MTVAPGMTISGNTVQQLRREKLGASFVAPELESVSETTSEEGVPEGNGAVSGGGEKEEAAEKVEVSAALTSESEFGGLGGNGTAGMV